MKTFSSSSGSPTLVDFVLVPRFNMMALTATIEPMRIANYLAPERLYEWHYLSAEGGGVEASNGMALDTIPVAKRVVSASVIFACGSWGCEHYESPVLFNWLRRQGRKGVILGALEQGVYLLARAGLMSGRRATTHWSCIAGFAEQFPKISVSEQLFTEDGNLITCAGGTAGVDLMLHLIARQHGDQLASEVADQAVHYPIRQADTLQRHTLGGATEDVHPDVKAAIDLIEANIEEPLSVPEIAAELGISQRQLERVFRRHMGCSTVQFARLIRLQYARVLLTSTRMSIREVSAASGFNSMSYFSQSFVQCFGKRPSEYRLAWPDDELAPAWPGTVFSFTANTKITSESSAG